MDHASITPAGNGLRRLRSNQSGSPRLRVVPWQGNRRVALVGPGRHTQRPTPADVARCLRRLDEMGVERSVTPALDQRDAVPFLEAGFVLLERLHLLSRPLHEPPPTPSRSLKPGRTWHRRAVLDIDRRAFEPFWQFDEMSLREARTATPSSRFRVAIADRVPVGYAVTGKAGNRGYLQRLAVDPDHEGEGLGTALVNDSLGWLHERGVRVVMVNTQERNQRALALYEHLGFRSDPAGLVVLERVPGQ